jgi:hypothetical protein
MPSAYDELLNVFDDQGLGEIGLTGWDPDQVSHPLTLVSPVEPAPPPPPHREVSLQGIAIAAGMTGLLLGLLFGRR